MDLTNYTEEQIKEIVLKYTTSKEKIKIAQKKYRQTDKYREYRKRHYQKNKEKIQCECGSILTKQHLNRHYKSIKHQKYL